MRQKEIYLLLFTVLLGAVLASCTEIGVTMPLGPQGPKGDTGLSAFEFWKEKVSDGTIAWPKNEVNEADYFRFLKGKDGANGKGSYEQWKEFIASGNVDDPHNPSRKWDVSKNTMQDFWWFLTGSTGEDGKTPYIGENGNWWIDGTDTKYKAKGENGKDGEDGKDGFTPYIGDDGDWWIGSKDTDVPAKGKDGKDGKDGADGKDGKDGTSGPSAYQLWAEAVAANCGTTNAIPDPHNPGQAWSCDKTSIADFWEYLRGKDGEAATGSPTVIAQLYNSQLKEYVDPADGGVWYEVFDKNGAKAPAGSQVQGMPGIDPNIIFETNNEGRFKIPAKHLPDNIDIALRKGSVKKVTINGESLPSTANTIVPNRINTRIVEKLVYLRQPTANSLGGGSYPASHFTAISYEYTRQVDGVWVKYPDELPKPRVTTARVIDPTQPISAANVDVSEDAKRWNIAISYSDYNLVTNTAMIIRPIVLTASEKHGTAPVPAISDYNKRLNEVRQYEWDGSKYYFTIKGDAYFYGQETYMMSAVHVPEIYPNPTFTDAKIDIVHGQTTIWGTIPQGGYMPFYTRYIAPTGPIPVWEAVRREGTEYTAEYQAKINSRIFTYRTQGAQIYTSYNNGSLIGASAYKFRILSAQPGMVITTMSYIGDDLKGKTTQAAQNELIYGVAFAAYRATPSYIVKKTNDNKYYLSDIFKHNPDIELPIEAVPAGWVQ